MEVQPWKDSKAERRRQFVRITRSIGKEPARERGPFSDLGILASLGTWKAVGRHGRGILAVAPTPPFFKQLFQRALIKKKTPRPSAAGHAVCQLSLFGRQKWGTGSNTIPSTSRHPQAYNHHYACPATGGSVCGLGLPFPPNYPSSLYPRHLQRRGMPLSAAPDDAGGLERVSPLTDGKPYDTPPAAPYSRSPIALNRPTPLHGPFPATCGKP